MTLFRQTYRVESTRLRDWDYTSVGWHFVTVCTGQQAPFLGKVIDREVQLPTIGQIVAEEWRRTPEVRTNVQLDEWVIMPNHVHGIIIIEDLPNVETPRWGVSTPLPSTKLPSLGSIVGQFKAVCTRRIWAAGRRDFSWQQRYYDHVIPDEARLQEIGKYIVNNPAKWELDKYNPNAPGAQRETASS